MPAWGLDFSLMFALGLASSLHCVTMCGPIIAVASAPLSAAGDRRARRWSALSLWQVRYHLGRGLSYAVIGAILALAGTVISSLFAAKFVGGLIQLVVGLALALGAVILVARGKALSAPSKGSRLSKAIRALVTSRRSWSMFALGLLTGLLPCGVLYAAFARAVAASSPLEGAWLMAAFWGGTVPLLFAVGLLSAGFFKVIGKYATAAVAIVMLLTGGWLVVKGWHNVRASSTSPCHEHATSVTAAGLQLVHRSAGRIAGC